MASDEVIIQRRFPTYDFVMRVDLSPSEASQRLDRFLQNQPRPRGFILSDPRVDGVVAGTSFTFHRREAGFAGSVTPFIEGYFVPQGAGAQVFVRTQIPSWWWVFDILVIIGVAASFATSQDPWGLLVVPTFALLLLALTCGPVWLEASQAAKLLKTVFARTAA